MDLGFVDFKSRGAEAVGSRKFGTPKIGTAGRWRLGGGRESKS